jgi:phosphatidylserine/phosphatidylglycerophosphate/cardiolipin synthase-like enzyme
MRRNPKIEAWQYFQYDHAKMYLFDRLAGYIGSWNLDRNSGDINHEAGVMCLDRSMARQIEYDFARDLSNSVPVVSRNGH